MKAKFAGKCVKTGRRFGVGANVKWLGKGKGCVLLDEPKTDSESDCEPFTQTPEWQNDAGEPLYNPTAEWRGAETDWHDNYLDR